MNKITLENALDDFPEELKTKDHKWTVLFRNGAKLEFSAGWNAVGNTPAPYEFKEHVGDFHTRGEIPYQSGNRINYVFPQSASNAAAMFLTIDIREVLAVHVTLVK